MAEQNLNFDKIWNRNNTMSLKYDFAVQRGMPQDVLPLWVADMDFATSSYIQDALKERIKHPIYGYSETGDDYCDVVGQWMKKNHNWDVKSEWLIKTPGVVFALAMAVKAYTEPGDCVLIQQPVYYPFSEVITDNHRTVVSNTLILGKDHRYHIDFEDFEEKIRNHHIRLFFLCSPHNPVGRVWTRQELERLGDICVRHGVVVVSDEIHHDFIFKGEHHVFAGLKDAYAEITVTCTSPSKTFNLAGMQISNIFIKNIELRKKFRQEVRAAGFSQLNVMGIVACQAAYSQGESWYQSMHAYIKENIEYIKNYVEKELNGVGVTMTEHAGTYLVWLDFRGTNLRFEELDQLMIEKAKLWLDSGAIFGSSGQGFQRLNAACPRETLKVALERIRKALVA